jgi:hypothetical protein
LILRKKGEWYRWGVLEMVRKCQWIIYNCFILFLKY